MARTVTLLPLLLVSACTAPAENQQGSGNETAAPSRSAAVPADARIPARDTAAAVQLALLPPSREGDAATTAGTLQAEGGCLYLRPVAGRRLFIAFTVPGIRWDAGTGALIVPGSNGAGSFRPGDRVRLGGSEGGAAALSKLWVAAPANGCDTSRIWIAHAVSTFSS